MLTSASGVWLMCSLGARESMSWAISEFMADLKKKGRQGREAFPPLFWVLQASDGELEYFLGMLQGEISAF